jgi:hypothetical protein
MMILREDLDGDREKEMVISFLLRSLMPGDAPAIDITEPRPQTAARPAKRRTPQAARRARS